MTSLLLWLWLAEWVWACLTSTLTILLAMHFQIMLTIIRVDLLLLLILIQVMLTIYIKGNKQLIQTGLPLNGAVLIPHSSLKIYSLGISNSRSSHNLMWLSARKSILKAIPTSYLQRVLQLMLMGRVVLKEDILTPLISNMIIIV